jgi:hypothetical protein
LAVPDLPGELFASAADYNSATRMRAARLSLHIKPSSVLAGALLLAHGGAIACTVPYLPGWWASAMACAALLASLAWHLSRSALLWSGNAVIALTLTDGARCELQLRNGASFAGIVEPTTFVAPLLVVLNVRDPVRHAHRSAILLPDSASAHDLRALRVWLRHRIRPDAPESGPL